MNKDKAIEFLGGAARSAGAACIHIAIVSFYVAVIVVVECINWAVASVRLLFLAPFSFMRRISMWFLFSMVAPIVPLIAVATAVGTFLGFVLVNAAAWLNVLQTQPEPELEHGHEPVYEPVAGRPEENHGGLVAFATGFIEWVLSLLHLINPTARDHHEPKVKLKLETKKLEPELVTDRHLNDEKLGDNPQVDPTSARPSSITSSSRINASSPSRVIPNLSPRSSVISSAISSALNSGVNSGTNSVGTSPPGVSPKAATATLYRGKFTLPRIPSVEKDVLQQQYEGFQQQVEKQLIKIEHVEHSSQKWRNRPDSPPVETPKKSSRKLQWLDQYDCLATDTYPVYEDDDGYLTPNKTPVEIQAWHYSSPIVEDENY